MLAKNRNKNQRFNKNKKNIDNKVVKNLTGYVLRYDDIKGTGIIMPTQCKQRVYVHRSKLTNYNSLRKDQKVIFDVIKTKALNVRLCPDQPYIKIFYGEILFYNEFRQFGFIKPQNGKDSDKLYFNSKQLFNYVSHDGIAQIPQKGDKIEYVLGKFGDKAFEIKRDSRILPKKKRVRKKRAKLSRKVNKNSIKYLSKKYKNEMNKCGIYETVVDLHKTSSYKDNINDGNDPKASNMKKIIKEVRNELSKRICLDYCYGSMFIRMDESNPRFLQCLLTGMDDTPYAFGLFLFDIYLCHGYPEIAPKIVHITKGHSDISAGFTPGGYSPNLHRSSGKVCLSLLGTWNGPGWQNGVSNVYQLLSTIMFCIFGAKHPYYMEPGNGGWEGTIDMNKNDHSDSVRDYDRKVLLHVLKYAILQTIKQPYPNFENVIKMFYKCKAPALFKWIETCMEDEHNKTIKNELQETLDELKIEIGKLKNFQIVKKKVIDNDIDSDLDLGLLEDDDEDDIKDGDGDEDESESIYILMMVNKSIAYSNS